ncbi:unnamed protein product [Sympodiomycopsis kandeliae]
MGSAAPVGPPPGLGPPKPQQSTNTSQPQRYSRSFLLQLSKSPLIEKPSSIPPFAEWFGEWETYTPRPHNHQHNSQHGHERYNNHHRGDYTSRSQGSRYPHVSEDASGPMGEFSFHKGGDASSSSVAGGGSGGGYLTGFQGVRRRDGERGAERGETGRGFRKYEDRHDRSAGGEERGGRLGGDHGEGLTRGGNPRFPSSGKNPFGQLSASGTFKPAGKDGTDPPIDKRGYPLSSRMGSYGRNEREPVQLDDNGRPIRQPRGKDSGNYRDRDQQRRRHGGIDGQEEELEEGEWETVPRSPETERRLARAGGLADSASDWRKGSGAAGLPKRFNDNAANARGGPRGARNDVESRRGGGGGGSSAFPSWMADSNETPSWMDDSPSTSSNTPLPSSGEKKERGRLNFDAFKGSEVHVTPMEGEDSIQAFKREMKRREAEARAKDGDIDSQLESKFGKHDPPPGLTRPSDDQEATSSRASSLKPPGLALEGDSADNHERDSDSRNSVARTGESEVGKYTPSSAPASGAQQQQQSSGSGRGSRFARFFDGAAATNRAKEAQERAMAAHAAAATSGSSPAAANEVPKDDHAALSPSAQNASAGNMAALFQGMALNASQGRGESRNEGSATSPGGQPSEADLQGMQKIMAMLRGGGGGPDANASPSQQSGPTGTNGPSSANLMAMLAGGALSQGRPETPGSPQKKQQHLSQHVPPGLAAAAAGGRASPAPPRAPSPGIGFGNRSQSPSMGFRGEHSRMDSASQQQLQQQYHNAGQSPTHYQHGPPPGFAGQGRGGSGGYGMDPRMLSRPPPGLGGGSNGGGSGANGAGPSPVSTPGAGGGNNGPPGMRGPGNGANGINLSGLPPQLQQQLMNMPPQYQHAILNGHARGPPPPFPPGMPPLPPGMGGPPGPPPPPGHHLGPFAHQPHFGLPPFLAGHQGPYGGGGNNGNGGSSPLPPGHGHGHGHPQHHPHHVGPYSPSMNQGNNAGAATSPGAGPAGGFPPPPGMMQGPPGIYGQGQQ